MPVHLFSPLVNRAVFIAVIFVVGGVFLGFGFLGLFVGLLLRFPGLGGLMSLDHPFSSDHHLLVFGGSENLGHRTKQLPHPGCLLGLVLVPHRTCPVHGLWEEDGSLGAWRDRVAVSPALLHPCCWCLPPGYHLARRGNLRPGWEGGYFPWMLIFSETPDGSPLLFVSGLPDVLKGLPVHVGEEWTQMGCLLLSQGLGNPRSVWSVVGWGTKMPCHRAASPLLPSQTSSPSQLYSDPTSLFS